VVLRTEICEMRQDPQNGAGLCWGHVEEGEETSHPGYMLHCFGVSSPNERVYSHISFPTPQSVSEPERAVLYRRSFVASISWIAACHAEGDMSEVQATCRLRHIREQLKVGCSV
jgi:hypothetical protein